MQVGVYQDSSRGRQYARHANISNLGCGSIPAQEHILALHISMPHLCQPLSSYFCCQMKTSP